MVTLTELSAKCVASFIPFELVEQVYPPVPEQLQLRIAYWSFPDNEDDIRLYSCLANSSADEFHRGDQLFKTRLVKDALQIGTCFYISCKYTLFHIIFRHLQDFTYLRRLWELSRAHSSTLQLHSIVVAFHRVIALVRPPPTGVRT